MTKKQYAESLYRVAALRARQSTISLTETETLELRVLEKAQIQFEDKQEAKAGRVLSSMMGA